MMRGSACRFAVAAAAWLLLPLCAWAATPTSTATPAAAGPEPAVDIPAPPAVLPDAPPEVSAAVEAHFKALLAENYTGADAWFSTAFRRAFKGDVQQLNTYYEARRLQLAAGYSLSEAVRLDDGPDRETARVTVDFEDPSTDAPLLVTERIYYYLIHEPAKGEVGADRSDRAWRIDIYDALAFDSLAEARRRPYLYTREAWSEDAGRELKSRQGLFRIQWALDSYFAANERFPQRLEGGDNRRDALINGGFIKGSYPPNGFNEKPMAAVDFGEKSSGDFTYLPLDTDSDGLFEGYFLLLHAKDRAGSYFTDSDVIYILTSLNLAGQGEAADVFATYWLAAHGRELQLTSAVNQPAPAAAYLPGETPELSDAGPVAIRDPAVAQPISTPPDPPAAVEPEEEHVLDPLSPFAAPLTTALASLAEAFSPWNPRPPAVAAQPVEDTAVEPVEPPVEIPIRPLRVYSYGF